MFYDIIQNQQPIVNITLYTNMSICLAAWLNFNNLQNNYNYRLKMLIFDNMFKPFNENEKFEIYITHIEFQNNINKWNKLNSPQCTDLKLNNTVSKISFHIEKTKKLTNIKENDFNIFNFLLFFKNNSEEFIGKINYDEILKGPNKTFCTNTSYTTGQNKTLGVTCTNEMSCCLNWRRTDTLGHNCKNLLTDKEKMQSINEFCKIFENHKDCKCKNILNHHKYLEMNNYDYCDDNHFSFQSDWNCVLPIVIGIVVVFLFIIFILILTIKLKIRINDIRTVR